MEYFHLDISEINSSSTIYIIVPVAKLRKYGSKGTTCAAKRIVSTEPIGKNISNNSKFTDFLKNNCIILASELKKLKNILE